MLPREFPIVCLHISVQQKKSEVKRVIQVHQVPSCLALTIFLFSRLAHLVNSGMDQGPATLFPCTLHISDISPHHTDSSVNRPGFHTSLKFPSNWHIFGDLYQDQ